MKTQTSLVSYSIVLCIALVSAGCAPQPEPIDVEAARSALLKADRAWSGTPPDVGAFVSYFAEGAHFLTPDGPLAVGRDQITEIASHLFALPGFSLSWDATTAAVSDSGELGYTVGTAELRMTDAEGNPVVQNGKYTTVWRKQAGGAWKVVVDAPNFDGPPTPADE